MNKTLKTFSKTKAAILLILGCFSIFYVAYWSYSNYIKYNEKTHNALKNNYIDTLSNNKNITLNDIYHIRNKNYAERQEVKLFIKGTVESYEIDNQSIAININTDDDETFSKKYKFNDITIINKDDTTSTLSENDTSQDSLDNKQIYIISNDNTDDDVFILS